MNAPATLLHPLPTLASSLFALLAPARIEDDAAPEAHWLASHAAGQTSHTLTGVFAEWRRAPPPEDRRLHRLAATLPLGEAEIVAVALATAADSDVIAGRALAWLQAPLRAAHPTPGLIACLEQQRGLSAAATTAGLLDGTALASGLLLLEADGRVLADAPLRVPPPLVSALSGGLGRWASVSWEDDRLPPLAPSLKREAQRRAAALETAVLAARSGHPAEARAACAVIAAELGRRAVFVAGDPPVGLGPWLSLHGALPVLCAEVSPGERRRVPELAGYRGPILLACGLEGTWERDGEAVLSWRIGAPPSAERVALWRAQGFDAAAAETLGRAQRHGSARIAQLADQARAFAEPPALRDVARAARAGGHGALGHLAELLPEEVDPAALILPDSLWRDLRALAARCLLRDHLADGLGPAARSRYRPGVRALFTGASGTGKTLSCGWLATELGLPLYRVDLATVTSKYIGETEKNLGELFGRAEQAEVILLFDEADALFGKRTDVKDSNDRFANQQTNYLLQRLESFEGIVLLTSNSRSRFDAAFTRRLDTILEFPAPGPEERRALWQAHLGDAHALSAAALNRVAAACELPGGQVRNVVFAARALAGGDRIPEPLLLQALAAEYRKLGKQIPTTLTPRSDG